MQIYFTRDSVCAGDDGDAPHARTLDLRLDLATRDVIVQTLRGILLAAPLPTISGGSATWCVSSILPLAIVAQQWIEPRWLRQIPPRLADLDFDGETLRLHFSYFAQHDPMTVYSVLQRLQVRADRTEH